jgi:hypothetical protein
MVAVNAAAILAYEEVDWSAAIVVLLQGLYVEFPVGVCMLWTVGQSPWLGSLQGPIQGHSLDLPCCIETPLS